jgi:ubiquinone/menaquinone biosynthesis C-methylase UbiE
MTSKNEVIEKIINRYEKESSMDCVLGCGNTIDNLKVTRGENLLDLGCGRGEETIQMALLAGDTGNATGLDLTQSMIDKAQENAKKENVKNVTFVHGEIEKLPFESNLFDGVASNCVINHAKDKNRVYMEIQRVLKQGGRFVISDAVSKYPLPAEVKNDPEAWAQCYGGAITEEQYLDAIYQAGFEEIQILNRREYLKNGYDFISLTIKAVK